MLSSRLTGIKQIVIRTAVVGSIAIQLQITIGTRTIDGPIRMIPRMRTAEVIKLAPGTPAATSPTPARNACRAETPMTPRDMAPMVAPASWTNFSPRPEPSLSENNEIALTSEGAGENKKPANTMAIKNLRIPIPAPSENYDPPDFEDYRLAPE